MTLVTGISGGGFADGTLADAAFTGPGAIAFSNGGLYVAEIQHDAIRYIDLDAGLVQTIVDGGANDPEAVIVVGDTLYVGDSFDSQINSFDLHGGAFSTVVSAADPYSSLSPEGFAFDGKQTLYVSDGDITGDDCILALDLATTSVSVLAGSCGNSGYKDGAGSAALFDEPEGLALDPSGNVYVADQGNNVIRMIAPGGNVSTFAGDAGVFAPDDTDGPPSVALFDTPLAMASDSKGDLFVSDFGGGLREIKQLPDGGHWVYTLAKYGYQSDDPLPDIAGLALDEAGGNLYATDYNLDQIWVFRGF